MRFMIRHGDLLRVAPAWPQHWCPTHQEVPQQGQWGVREQLKPALAPVQQQGSHRLKSRLRLGTKLLHKREGEVWKEPSLTWVVHNSSKARRRQWLCIQQPLGSHSWKRGGWLHIARAAPLWVRQRKRVMKRVQSHQCQGAGGQLTKKGTPVC